MVTLWSHIHVQLVLCFKNNLTGTGRCNNIHSTHIAHQTDNRCFDFKQIHDYTKLLSKDNDISFGSELVHPQLCDVFLQTLMIDYFR